MKRVVQNLNLIYFVLNLAQVDIVLVLPDAINPLTESIVKVQLVYNYDFLLGREKLNIVRRHSFSGGK